MLINIRPRLSLKIKMYRIEPEYGAKNFGGVDSFCVPGSASNDVLIIK